MNLNFQTLDADRDEEAKLTYARWIEHQDRIRWIETRQFKGTTKNTRSSSFAKSFTNISLRIPQCIIYDTCLVLIETKHGSPLPTLILRWKHLPLVVEVIKSHFILRLTNRLSFSDVSSTIVMLLTKKNGLNLPHTTDRHLGLAVYTSYIV